MSKLIVGIDIDNVIAQTDELIRELIKAHYGIDARQEQITDWHYNKSLPITEEEELYVLDEFHTRFCSIVNLIPSALPSLIEISRICEIWILTSRPENTRSCTIEWLNENNLPYDMLFFTRNKPGIVNDCNLVVDDNGDTALEIAKMGINVLLFDYPWNRYVVPNPKITRVSSWSQITQFIHKLFIYANPLHSNVNPEEFSPSYD